MIPLIRMLGVMLIAAGIVVILTWLIKPLRTLWPLLIDSFRGLPIAVQIGLALATMGFLLLFCSIIWERIEDRKQEANLLKDD